MKFWNELRRRKVPRTLLAYLAAAFVAAQAVDLLVGALELPEELLTTVVVIEIALIPFVFAVAWFYDWSSAGIQETDTPAASINWKRVAPAAGLTLLLILIGLFIAFRRPAQTLDEDLVAVLPFRVSGSADIGYLREGMMDLLAAKLTGEGGPRAADSRSVVSALRNVMDGEGDVSREQALDVARALGASQVLLGSAVGSANRLTITAKLTDVRSGKEVSAELTGSADTLAALIDHFAAQLLSLRAGEGQRLAALTSTSLPALKAYLAAQSDYRAARFASALQNYRRALDLDSTFALAAMGHVLSTGWGVASDTTENRSRRLLVHYRNRLGELDRAMAVALGGESYPDRRNIKQKIDAWERVITMAPDRSEAWFLYGDVLTHTGGLAEVADNWDLAVQSFDRSLRLDSTHTPALVHLVDFAIMHRDTARLRKLEAIKKARNARTLTYQQPAILRFMGDTAGSRAIQERLDTLSLFTLYAFAFRPLVYGEGAREAIPALELSLKRSTSREEQRTIHSFAYVVYLGMGMPSKAAEQLRRRMRVEPDRVAEFQALALSDALYGDGDLAIAESVIAELRANPDRNSGVEKLAVACAYEQWRLWRGEPSNAIAVARQLRAVPRDSDEYNSAIVCALVLEALDAAVNKRPNAAASLTELDNYLKVGPPCDEALLNVANMVASRLWERRGDLANAYRAISRQAYHPAYMQYYPDMVRERARLALLNDDRQTAIREYTRYLGFHEIAEPALKSRDDAVRRELSRLTTERN